MPTINCTEFSRQLAEHVERRASIDTADLREHAAACPQCREEWLDSLIVERAVAGWKKPVPSAGLTDRILAQVAAGAAPADDEAPVETQVTPAREVTPAPGGAGRRSPDRRLIGTAGLGLTALALGLLTMLLFRRPAPPVNPSQPDVAQSAAGNVMGNPTNHMATVAPVRVAPAPVAVLPVPAPEDAPVELMVADAGSAYLHLAGDAAKAVTAATVLVPSADPVADEPAAQPSDDHWVDGVRQEIEPVTHQLSHAFEFLIQAVPEKRTPAT